MFKQLFASMHDVLDEVMKLYPTADVTQKKELHKKLEVLRTMSDTLIEEWLRFEEKMAMFMEQQQAPEGMDWKELAAGCSPNGADPLTNTDAFKRGQGYFQLLMYDNAIREFDDIIRQHPDFMLARLYLAMGHLRQGNEAEAYRHFRFIVSLSDHSQMKAISYNAMGCIQAKNDNFEQARELFQKAYEADPSSVQPMINMGICMSHGGGSSSVNGWTH